MGSDIGRAAHVHQMQISIHAPAWGATVMVAASRIII